jgi:magnesium chelatase subunit H
MPHEIPPEQRDSYVFRLHEQLLDMEQRLIPMGLHVFGEANQNHAADALQMIAAFDRPEIGVRSLPCLIAEGLSLPEYPVLLRESSKSEDRLDQRLRVEGLVREAVGIFLAGGLVADPAVAFLVRTANVGEPESRSVFALLGRVADGLSRNHEVDSLMRALRGEYIEPGPGADIVQNPEILPTGRNTHAVNPYVIPSVAAFRKSEAIVAALLQRSLGERGRYPETIGMVLWGMDNIKTQGEGLAQALLLMGVEPRRDTLNRVTDVDVIPLERLGRPRIDLVLTVSGIFRDLFGTSVEVLDKAVRRVAALDEPDNLNFIRKHVYGEQLRGSSFADSATRVFSNAPGSYGTNVNFMVTDGQWERAEEIGDLFITRKCFAFGRGLDGNRSRELMERALSRVEVTYQNIDSAEVGVTDVDHYFEYLGGMTQAVEARSGCRPDVYLSDALSTEPRIRSLSEVVRLETRTKTLNPKWYEGMLNHGFSGVAEIEHHVTNTFGWSATAGAVDEWIYDEIAGRYILDAAMLQRLRSMNPYAARSLTARLIEAQGRGFWAPDAGVMDQLHDALGGLEDQIERAGTGAER